MKLSFSTLGCPNWSFAEIVEKGRAYGFDGVGFRGVAGELDLRKVPEFAPDRLPDSRRRLEQAGLVASMVLTSTRLISPEDQVEANLQLAESHIAIAAGLGAPTLRVFGGQFPVGLSHEAAVRRAGERLRRLGDYAAPRGVLVLLETHDDFTDPALLRRVIEAADHPYVGVLWDVHHPFRILGHTVESAWSALGPFVRAVDIKDSATDFATRLGYRYVELGHGQIPVEAALGLLKRGGYDGWLTFEWEKMWHPELAEPEQSFPNFIATIRQMLGRLET